MPLANKCFQAILPSKTFIYNYIPDRYKFIQDRAEMAQKQITEIIGHSPTLNTVMMVEEALKEAGEIVTIAELKRKLPKQIMHQTLITILDYLQLSGKIMIGTKGILWIHTERKELNRLTKKGTEI